jgi:signal recognition particle subunit SRP54
MHQEMESAMKRIKKMGGLKGLAALFGKSGDDLGAAMEGMNGFPQGSLPKGMGSLPGLPGGGASGLPPEIARILGKKR